MPNRWALLIGVDFYFPGNAREVQFNHLSGCVRDVDRIEQYLRGIGVHNIERLTSSNVGKANEPGETDGGTYPTYHNIEEKLDGIRGTVEEGDLVYIHYSGHGILRHELKDLDDEDGDAITGTALALADVMAGGAYLTGYQLGVWARRLVEVNKVRVSITLDCCYSGRGHRGPGIVLRTSEDSEFDGVPLESDKAADAAAVAVEAELPEPDTDDDEPAPGQRNATVKRSWLSSPEGCTVLTACQVNEKAGEYRFEGQQGRNGILTHWMLDLFDRHAGACRPTYARLAQHAKSSMRTAMSLDRPQTPVLHGDSFYEFFGTSRLIQRPACIVRVSKQPGSLDTQLTVDVGTAQGVAKGAVYTVYPPSWDLSLPEGQQQAPGSRPHSRNDGVAAPKVRVDKPSVFTSSAIPIEAENIQQDMAIVMGSLAVLDTWSLSKTWRVGVESTGEEHLAQDQRFRATVEDLVKEITAIPEFSLHSRISTGGSPACEFLVSLNRNTRSIEICDGRGARLHRVPAVPIDDEGAVAKVAYMLKHLSRYKALANLDYGRPPDSLATDSYRFELLDRHGQALQPATTDKTYHVENGQAVTVRFANQSTTENVQVAMFMFNATWGIERIYPEDGQPTAQAVPSDTQALLCGLDMYIPPPAHTDDPPDIYDLIRAYIYVGDHPPSWDELLLPDVPPDADLLPVDLPVEPVLEEDLGGGSDDDTRNKKPKRPSRKPHKVTAAIDPWNMLEFRVHTRPSK
ncbi:hypothetical protein BKA56DRAFT_94633 [Ilyonectria sp. MPI-CAGE-AT-0026]|nr:hypothetical protein BKA56DRAFT_94633 [Ilyonectria sp. MPI-CAGE-AT-0026]